MMNKIKVIMLLLGVIVPTAFSIAKKTMSQKRERPYCYI